VNKETHRADRRGTAVVVVVFSGLMESHQMLFFILVCFHIRKVSHRGAASSKAWMSGHLSSELHSCCHH